MPKQTLSIRLAPDLMEQVEARGAKNLVVERDLARYYGLLAETMPTITERFARNELCLICDACNGIALWESRTLALMWAEVADHIRLNGAAAKWGVTDADDLVSRVRDLTPLERTTLGDGIERFWERADDDTDLALMTAFGV